jgi:uncharacterized protein YgbK (DUF1537 family)
MTPAVFGAVADDDTGATDLAGMLADQGVDTVLIIDIAGEECFDCWASGYDAVIVGAGSRALAPREAYQRARHAIRLLERRAPRVIEIKYCSTFDSTPQGNIGPSIDAAMEELEERFTVALPALPVNGRTTYMGYHFVNGQLLSDSPMRAHPLTPMTNPNLVTHLQQQTSRRVGLAHYPVTPERIEAVRAAGAAIAILDCVSEADLESVCEAIAELRLITGSSAPAMELPRIWQRKGWWKPTGHCGHAPEPGGSGILIVAGSCSEATRAQNRWIEHRAVAGIQVDALRLAAAEPDSEAIERAVSALRAGDTCLLRTNSEPDEVARIRSRFTDVNHMGLAISHTLAQMVREVFERQAPRGLVVAGGETAGAICRTLKFGALEVGCNIQPGIPLCLPLHAYRIPVILKSGNFGSQDFYLRAAEACEARYRADLR